MDDGLDCLPRDYDYIEDLVERATGGDAQARYELHLMNREADECGLAPDPRIVPFAEAPRRQNRHLDTGAPRGRRRWGDNRPDDPPDDDNVGYLLDPALPQPALAAVALHLAREHRLRGDALRGCAADMLRWNEPDSLRQFETAELREFAKDWILFYRSR